MARQTTNHQEPTTDDVKKLRISSTFSPVTTVLDSNRHKHSLRKFELLGKWGICNADKTKIIVDAKSNYLYANVLPNAQVLVAGSASAGWDVYSLTGKLFQHFAFMSFSQVEKLLETKGSKN